MNIDFLRTSSKTQEMIISYLVILFPVTLISIKVVGNLILLILALIGLKIFIFEKINPFKERNLRIFSYLFIGYFFLMLFSIILSSGFGPEIKHVARKLHFLFAPLIALSLYKFKFSFHNLLTSIKLSLPIMALIILIQFYFFDVSRPSGFINANVFSDLIVTLGFVSIANIFYETKKDFLLSTLSFSSALIILIYSASRGSWVSFVVIFCLFLIFSFRKFSIISKLRRRVILILLIFFGLLSFNFSKISDTYYHTIQNIAISDANQAVYTSSGIRLLMWKSAIKAFNNESPWHGFGYRNVNKKVAEYSENHKEIISKYTHLHNEYLTNLLSAGYLGLIYVLSIIFIPLIIFFKSRRDEAKYFLAISGIFVCASYFISGLTHIAFGEEHVNALYIFMMALLMPRVLKDL